MLLRHIKNIKNIGIDNREKLLNEEENKSMIEDDEKV
jgi:hypothetical protein